MRLRLQLASASIQLRLWLELFLILMMKIKSLYRHVNLSLQPMTLDILIIKPNHLSPYGDANKLQVLSSQLTYFRQPKPIMPPRHHLRWPEAYGKYKRLPNWKTEDSQFSFLNCKKGVRFQLLPMANRKVKKGAECVSLRLSVHSLSSIKTLTVPPRGNTR